jgi:hypothetical protein
MTATRRLGLLVVMAAMFFTIYGVIAAAQVGGELHTLETAIDRAIPFSAWWILSYGALYPVVLSPLVIFTDWRIAKRGALGIALVVLSGVPFWIWYPVTVPRYPIEVKDIFDWGVVVVRYVDPPTNCFPSMHVAEAAFASLLVWRHDRLWGGIISAITLSIWYSSLAIGQHWFVDGLVGIGIAVAADQIAFRGVPREACVSRDRRWHLAWIGVYALLFVLFASPWIFGWLSPEDLAGRWAG